jgi:hypothetical protein
MGMDQLKWQEQKGRIEATFWGVHTFRIFKDGVHTVTKLGIIG